MLFRSKLHKISRDKNLTESVHRKISHTMRNSLAASCGFVGCAKFHTMCEICPSLSPAAAPPLDFACYAKFSHRHAKLLHVGFFFLWFSFLHLILAWQPIAKLDKGL